MPFINTAGWTGLDEPAIQAKLGELFPQELEQDVYLSRRESASYKAVVQASRQNAQGLRVENPEAYLFMWPEGILTMTNKVGESLTEEVATLEHLGRDEEGNTFYAFPEIVTDEYDISLLAIVRLTT